MLDRERITPGLVARVLRGMRDFGDFGVELEWDVQRARGHLPQKTQFYLMLYGAGYSPRQALILAGIIAKPDRFHARTLRAMADMLNGGTA